MRYIEELRIAAGASGRCEKRLHLGKCSTAEGGVLTDDREVKHGRRVLGDTALPGV
jgi:hypothetical protein